MTIDTMRNNGRISVSTSGRKGMDKVVESAFDAIDNGEEVILMNEHGDTCTLDDSLFLHGSYNVKFAIRQFAKGERVTGAVVLNGKEYPVVKAEIRRAEEERNRAMSYVNTSADAIDAAVEAEIEIVNNGVEEIADITDAETAEVIPVERFWCEVEIAELSEQDAADIVAHFHGQDGANKFFKMRATELDGSEEDIDGDNVFDYLPDLDELNDVDIDDGDGDGDDDNNNDVQTAEQALEIKTGEGKSAVDYLTAMLKPVLTERTNRLNELDALEAVAQRLPYDLKVHVHPYVLRKTDEYFATASLKDSLEYAILRINRMKSAEVDPAEYAISEAAMEVAINAEWRNAQVASGNYSITINGEYVRFENHSIVRIDAERKMNWIYDHTGKNKIFRYGNRKSSAAKVIAWYMNRERAKEQDEYFREFFIPYNKARGTIEVWVILTYADGEEHTFRAEFNQGRLADKFIADVKELAGDTPCQTFIKYRNNYVKPVWEDPHDFTTVGNLEHARHLYGEETVGDIAPEEYIITQEAFDEAVEAAELEALFAKWTAETLSDPRIEAAYRKARERVEVEFTSYGIPLYTYIKKNGERCYEDFVAKSYITKCGLRETDFIVKARAETKITRDRRTENNDLTEAEELTAKLKEVTRKVGLMDITTQDGNKYINGLCNLEVFIDPDSDGFIFTNGYETLARYDTKEQCEYVIDWLKRTVEDGDGEFEFQTAELATLEINLQKLLLREFKANYRYIGRHCWQMRIGDKWRNAPHRFLTAQLKYYGLTPAQLKEAAQ